MKSYDIYVVCFHFFLPFSLRFGFGFLLGSFLSWVLRPLCARCRSIYRSVLRSMLASLSLLRPSFLLWKDAFRSVYTKFSGFVFDRLTFFFYVIHILGK